MENQNPYHHQHQQQQQQSKFVQNLFMPSFTNAGANQAFQNNNHNHNHNNNHNHSHDSREYKNEAHTQTQTQTFQEKDSHGDYTNHKNEGVESESASESASVSEYIENNANNDDNENDNVDLSLTTFTGASNVNANANTNVNTNNNTSDDDVNDRQNDNHNDNGQGRGQGQGETHGDVAISTHANIDIDIDINTETMTNNNANDYNIHDHDNIHDDDHDDGDAPTATSTPTPTSSSPSTLDLASTPALASIVNYDHPNADEDDHVNTNTNVNTNVITNTKNNSHNETTSNTEGSMRSPPKTVQKIRSPQNGDDDTCTIATTTTTTSTTAANTPFDDNDNGGSGGGDGGDGISNSNNNRNRNRNGTINGKDNGNGNRNRNRNGNGNHNSGNRTWNAYPYPYSNGKNIDISMSTCSMVAMTPDADLLSPPNVMRKVPNDRLRVGGSDSDSGSGSGRCSGSRTGSDDDDDGNGHGHGNGHGETESRDRDRRRNRGRSRSRVGGIDGYSNNNNDGPDVDINVDGYGHQNTPTNINSSTNADTGFDFDNPISTRIVTGTATGTATGTTTGTTTGRQNVDTFITSSNDKINANNASINTNENSTNRGTAISSSTAINGRYGSEDEHDDMTYSPIRKLSPSFLLRGSSSGSISTSTSTSISREKNLNENSNTNDKTEKETKLTSSTTTTKLANKLKKITTEATTTTTTTTSATTPKSRSPKRSPDHNSMSTSTSKSHYSHDAPSSSVLGYHFLESDEGVVHAIINGSKGSGSGSGNSSGNRASRKHSKFSAVALHYGKEGRFMYADTDDAGVASSSASAPTAATVSQLDDNANNDDDLETSSEANSLVSEYGSDIGEIRVRMEDIHAMDALMEEGEGDEDEDEEKESESDSNNYSNGNKKQEDVRMESIDLSQDHHDRVGEMNTADDQFISTPSGAASLEFVELNDSKISDTGMEYIHSGMKQHQDSTPNTPIAAVSAAIRRIGTGVSQMATRCNNEESASSTFEYVPFDDIRYSNSIHNISSNGSKKNRKVWLSPRFDHRVESLKESHREQVQISSPSRKQQHSTTQLLTSPLRNVRGCFSFDPEGGVYPYGDKHPISPPSSPLRRHRKSKSWGSSGAEILSDHLKGLIGQNTECLTKYDNHAKVEMSNTPKSSRSHFLQHKASPLRMLSNISPRRKKKKKQLDHKQAIGLDSPQRVKDIEREDALDILTLMVERSLGFQSKNTCSDGMKETSKDCFSDDASNSSESLADIQKCLEYFRNLSNQRKDDNEPYDHDRRMKILDDLEQCQVYSSEMRRAALSASTWLRSVGRNLSTSSSGAQYTPSKQSSQERIFQTLAHAYQEQLEEKDNLNRRLDQELSTCRAEIGRLKSMHRNENKFTSPDKSILDDEVDDDDSSSSTNDITKEEFPNVSNMSDIKLSINSNIMNENYNEISQTAELRKEIFLLRAQLEESRKAMAALSKTNEMEAEKDDDNIGNNSMNQASKFEESKDKNDDNSCENSTFEVITQDALKEELAKYVEAVREEDRTKINISNVQNENTMALRGKEISQETKMVHVQMLDSENFVTEWNKLGPLPPPPDHDLDSPIVSTLLEQWTTDKSTRDSLLLWIEAVMKGEDPAMIQPLQLSSLNHQVRDGFTMHLLPILLRRSDIHVEVTTRAHRYTSYDIAVSIESSEPLGDNKWPKSDNELDTNSTHMMAFKASGGGDRSESMETMEKNVDNNSCLHLDERNNNNDGASVTHSSSTAQISNYLKGSQLNRISQNTSQAGMQKRHSSQGQSSIMTGAFNAVGGLLNRRKTCENPNQYRNNEGWGFKSRSNYQASVPNAGKTDVSSSCSADEEEQPYHRVVSAPPGKIGITFVQYRGHAMISDVYEDSPLIGWVFPSDILIAIDEVPVSGMRVPEIVRLLTTRKGRQRALRLISSHAMSELLITENSGALIDS